MTIFASALHGVLTAGSIVVAEAKAEFDPDKVSPGAPGFIATAVFAVAVIALGFFLVQRLRRNAYRHEVRESIAAELAERERSAEGDATEPGATPDASTDSDGRATPPTP